MKIRSTTTIKIKTNKTSKNNAARTKKGSVVVDACTSTDDLTVKKYVDACSSTDDLIVKNHVDACISIADLIVKNYIDAFTSTDDIGTNENNQVLMKINQVLMKTSMY